MKIGVEGLEHAIHVGEKALVAQLLVILNRVARIAVMRRSAFGKIRRQFQAFLLQPLLLRRQLKIHASGA